MKLGLYMNTHGVGATVDGQWTLQPVPAEEMAVAATARRAEEAGFDSLWFSDHVLMAPSPTSLHSAADPVTGARAYPPSPDMIDAIVAMSVAAAVTSRVRLAPSVWISPYRHPLNDVRQLTSIDQVSGGRLVAALGVGWMKEEFAALAIPYGERLERLEEAVEIYRRAWVEDTVSYAGKHFAFDDVRMDPKPVQKPRPPIYYGGITRTAARLAARCCDGLYPTFTDPQASADRYRAITEELPVLLDEAGRAPEDFALLAVTSTRVEDAGHRPRSLGFTKGSVEEILTDLEALAAEGFSLVVMHLDTVDGTHDEWRRQLDLVGEQVLPAAAAIQPAGPWAPATPGAPS